MRGLSQEVRKVLEQLNQPADLVSRLMHRQPDRAGLLRRLGEIGELDTIPHIVNYGFSRERATAAEAVRAIEAILARQPRRALLRLERIIREQTVSDYPELSPLELKRIRERADEGAALAGVASFHANGQVREEAVRALGEFPGGGAIPYLLIRLNDWVEPVRRAAREAIEKKLDARHAPSFLANLELVLRLRECRRDAHEPTVKAILSLLGGPECQGMIHGMLRAQDRAVRRQAFRLLLENPAENPMALLALAEGNRDGAEGLLAAREALRRTPEAALMPIYQTLWRSRFAPVRREGLEALSARDPKAAVGKLNEALFDPNGGIRRLARRRLEASGMSRREMAETYQKALGEEAATGARAADLMAALLGFGETAEAEDSGVIEPYLNDSRPPVRRAAIRALARLAPERHVRVFLEQIKAEEPAVSNEAREAIRRILRRVDIEQLWKTYVDSASGHVRRNLIALFNSLDKWDRLGLMLAVLNEGVETERATALENFKACLSTFNRTYTHPSPGQANRIRANLRRLGSYMDDRLRRQLERLIAP